MVTSSMPHSRFARKSRKLRGIRGLLQRSASSSPHCTIDVYFAQVNTQNIIHSFSKTTSYIPCIMLKTVNTIFRRESQSEIYLYSSPESTWYDSLLMSCVVSKVLCVDYDFVSSACYYRPIHTPDNNHHSSLGLSLLDNSVIRNLLDSATQYQTRSTAARYVHLRSRICWINGT